MLVLNRDFLVLRLPQACWACLSRHRSPSISAMKVGNNIAEPLDTHAHYQHPSF
jgi:hypothetical protein